MVSFIPGAKLQIKCGQPFFMILFYLVDLWWMQLIHFPSLCYCLTGDVAVLHRGTPLYGQPAWWGDGDVDDQQPGRLEEKIPDRKRDKAETGCFSPSTETAIKAVIDLNLVSLHIFYSHDGEKVTFTGRRSAKLISRFVDRGQERYRRPKVQSGAQLL